MERPVHRGGARLRLEGLLRGLGRDAYLDFFRQNLSGSCDIVLVDSRTGVTEHGGVCTHHLADVVVLISAANDLNLEGTLWMAGILSDDRLVKLRGGRPLDLMPVAARFEQTSEATLLLKFRERFRRDFARFLVGVVDDPLDFLKRSEIPYIPHYAFTESVVARMPAGRRISSLYEAYETVARVIVAWGIRKAGLRVPEPGIAALLTAPPTSAAAELGGRFVLRVAPDHAPLGEALSPMLSAAGVKLWAPEIPDSPMWPAGFAGLSRTAGAVIVAGNDPGWLESELNAILRRQATTEGYRALVLVPSAVDVLGKSALLRRFRTIKLPDTLVPDVATRIVAELMTERPLAPELKDVPAAIGAQPISEARARFLLGRDAEIEHVVGMLVRKAREGPVWFVLGGAPGVGKTSFVSAGILPALRRSRSEPPGDGYPWAVTIDLATMSLDAAARLLRNVEGARVVVVDEVERLVQPADSSGAGMEQMLELTLSRATRPPITITIVRGDVVTELLSRPALGRHRARAIEYTLRPLDADQLRTVCDGHARLVGLQWEAGLRERIQADLGQLPTVPAVVGTLFRELQAGTVSNRVTHEAYERLGRVQGVFGRMVRTSLEALTPAQQSIGRRIVAALVVAVEGDRFARRASTRASVIRAASSGPDADEVMDVLARAGVVTIGDDAETTVQLGSDDVLGLDPVKRWLHESTADVRLVEALRRAAETWEAQRRDPAWLVIGEALRRLQNAPWRTDLEEQFLEAAAAHAAERGRDDAKRRRGGRRTLAAAVAGIVLAVVGLGSFFVTLQRSGEEGRFITVERARAEAEKSRAEAEAARAETERSRNAELQRLIDELQGELAKQRRGTAAPSQRSRSGGAGLSRPD